MSGSADVAETGEVPKSNGWIDLASLREMVRRKRLRLRVDDLWKEFFNGAADTTCMCKFLALAAQ